MFDYVECGYPLPDGFVPPPGTEWQTQDTPAQWLASYRLAPDGTLIDSETQRPLPFHGRLLKIEGARRFDSDRVHLSRAEFFAVAREDAPRAGGVITPDGDCRQVVEGEAGRKGI